MRRPVRPTRIKDPMVLNQPHMMANIYQRSIKYFHLTQEEQSLLWRAEIKRVTWAIMWITMWRYIGLYELDKSKGY